ncbi:MAG TPA: glycerol-3-phosphate 1-O-acyltransferase PlsY, partial [Hyphomonadaceae bacterium]|nr:glycerol-3-phosphate 1-O-acyltransferase PlsY [Hyphomonadaceae bacterium]
YLLGSIPFGLVITKLAGLGDIRTIGSGNIGATNVLRTGRKDLALLTLILDIGKAGIAFLICWQAALAILVPMSTEDVYAAVAHSDSYSIGLCGGAFAFVGHCFPVWLGFKGGKGVATFVGLLAAADWRVALGFGVIWLVMAAVARMSSFAGLVAALGTPIMAHFLPRQDFLPLQDFQNDDLQYVTAALAILIFWRHRANIKRIIDGTEPKIGAKKKAAAAEAPPGSSG